MLNNLQAIVWAVVQLCKEAPLVKRRLEIKTLKFQKTIVIRPLNLSDSYEFCRPPLKVIT